MTSSLLFRDKLRAAIKDEHGYGSYPRGETPLPDTPSGRVMAEQLHRTSLPEAARAAKPEPYRSALDRMTKQLRERVETLDLSFREKLAISLDNPIGRNQWGGPEDWGKKKDEQGRPLKKDGKAFDVRQLIDTDWDTDWATEYKAQDISNAVLGKGQKPEEVGAAMFAGLPGDLTLQVGAQDLGKERIVRVVAFQTADDNADDSSESLYVRRDFIKDESGRLTVQHDIFQLPPGEQGSGIAKTILADSMAVYEKLGVAQIKTEANIDVGGYAWAKFGFTAANPSAFADEILGRLGGLDLPRDRERQMKAFITANKSDPKLPWKLAAMTDGTRKIGKEAMLGSSWAATFDLKNKESMARFKAYVSQ